jgi:hypothetical protein
MAIRATMELIMMVRRGSDLLACPNENEHKDEKTGGKSNEKEVLHKSLG